MSQPAAAANRRPNRLRQETSPYLLQHAYNPVDWRPWGSEAFDAARAEDKPVFLSVGYSACHWCHVMERESFESDEIAAILNRAFISIKVDREERPDVDQIYMAAVQALTHRGGWPMSVFLTPDQQPFFGGTYWPPESRYGQRGFREILLLLEDLWRSRREDVRRSADSLTDAVQRLSRLDFDETELNAEVLRTAQRDLLASADSIHGGFGGAPKFPHPMDVRLLQRTGQRFGSTDADSHARLTLDQMASGGVYDQLGGGFHRYSTDARWLVPHFEKMLYDNALLAPAYLDRFRLERRPQDERVVRETLDYLLREMTSPEGGFYSTQDADSEGVEGKFFVWSEAEIVDLLGAEDARLFAYCYDVTSEGNWEHTNILNRPKTSEAAARVLGCRLDVLEERLAAARAVLLARRSQRIPPGRDDKVLSGWNGLAMSAFAQAGWALDEPRYTHAAGRAADFLLSRMRDADGRLLHTFKDGQARVPGFLEDYACVLDGLVELFQAESDPKWLTAAIDLAERMQSEFADPDAGGFFFTPIAGERLITRIKDVQDNATPSGNGMAAWALLRLSRLTGRQEFEDEAVRALRMMSGLMAQHPRAAGQALLALDFLQGPAREIVILDSPRREEGDALQREIARRFLPHTMCVRHPSPSEIPDVLQGLLGGRTLLEGRATAYVCERQSCQAPVNTPEALGRLLDQLSRR